MRNLSTTLQAHRNQLEDEFPWVWLYGVVVPTTPTPSMLRLTNNLEPVTFGTTSSGAAITWSPFPIVHGPIRQSADGGLPTMDIEVSNITLELAAQIEAHDALRDQAVLIKLINLADTSNPSSCIEDRGEVRTCRLTAHSATFTVAGESLFKLDFPRRRYSARSCAAHFGDEACGYVIPATPSNTVGGGFNFCRGSMHACKERGDDEVARGLARKHPQLWNAWRGLRRLTGSV